MRAATFVLRRMGGSCAQAEKPEIQEPGRPEGLPRTAAITQIGGRKNAPAIVGGRLCACILPGSQARSLILQRQGETRFVAGAGQPLKRRCLCLGPNHPTPPHYSPANTAVPYQPTLIAPRLSGEQKNASIQGGVSALQKHRMAFLQPLSLATGRPSSSTTAKGIRCSLRHWALQAGVPA